MPVAWASGFERALKRQEMPPMTPEYIAFSNAHEIATITGSLFAATLFVVLCRCYVRITMLKVFGGDDWMMLVAMFFSTATFMTFMIEIKYGLGRHTMVLMSNPAMYGNFAKALYVHSLVVMVGISCIKISIALALKRVFGSKTQGRFLWGAIAFIIAVTISCAGTLIFQCLPVQAAWDSSLRPPPIGTGHANCFSSSTFRDIGLMNSIFNIFTDILFATLPIPLVWKLQLNSRTKVSLIAVLSLGWFACAAAIVKAVLQWSVLEDPDWTVHDSFNVWNYIELSIGIIAASLPSLKPLFNWALNTARAITSGGRTRATGTAYKGPNSLGYHDMGDQSNSRSIHMQSLKSRGDSTTGETRRPYSVQISTLPTGLADREAWDMVNAKDSDESIRPLEPGPKDIVMTTEVRVQ